jgi:hypothetical protein
MTIGIVEVARFAAVAIVLVPVTMTSTRDRTMSAASDVR